MTTEGCKNRIGAIMDAERFRDPKIGPLYDEGIIRVGITVYRRADYFWDRNLPREIADLVVGEVESRYGISAVIADPIREADPSNIVLEDNPGLVGLYIEPNANLPAGALENAIERAASTLQTYSFLRRSGEIS